MSADSMNSSIYRIVQEALTNTIRHGGRKASIILDFAEAELTILVEDEGSDGPQPVWTTTAGSGHGLVGMRERVAVFGGQLTTGPSPNGGFGVRATLPLKAVVS